MAEISKVRTIGDVVRPPMLASNRYDDQNAYNKNHPDIFSEGISGDNRGKEPASPPQTTAQAFNTVGGKDDIIQRITLNAKNTFKPGQREYTQVI